MTHLGKCLPPKHKDLISTLRTDVKSHIGWQTLRTPALGRQKQEDTWGLLTSQIALLVSSRLVRDSV